MVVKCLMGDIRSIGIVQFLKSSPLRSRTVDHKRSVLNEGEKMIPCRVGFSGFADMLPWEA